MSVAIVTGSAGLIGSETTRFLTHQGLEVAGIDNDMRGVFFGADASTAWNRRRLEAELHSYRHFEVDIRDGETIDRIFERYGRSISAVVHTAAQPSHDWAARDPRADFTTNANGTLEVLEATRRHCPDAAFIFTSTNKVYGDRPNALPLIESDSRWELDTGHQFAANGIDETMSIDSSLHSIFGASKIAAGHDGAGVRTLLRHEDRLLSRRMSYWAEPFRHSSAWLPSIPRAMCCNGNALCRTRIQG